jgi:secretion/DNA translocation related TadE-like protein
VTGRDQRGTATVLAVSVAGILLLVALALIALGGLVVAQRRAATAADLAALAGATAVQQGSGGCDVAAELARRNGALLVSCRRRGSDLQLRVEVRVDLPIFRSVDVSARARAGPGEVSAAR